MLNAESSVDGTLWNAFRHWEASASLDESIMRMEDFISTCFAISDGSFEVEKLIFSMSTVTTQTLRRLEALRSWDTTMQSRMVTLFAEDWEDQSWIAEVEMVRLMRSGRRSRQRRIEMSFGNWCTDWILSLLHAHSRSSRSTQTGNFALWSQHTRIQQGFRSLEEILMGDLIGLDNLELAERHH